MDPQLVIPIVAAVVLVGLVGALIAYDSRRSAALNASWSAYAQSRGMRYSAPVKWSWGGAGDSGTPPRIEGTFEGVPILIEGFHARPGVWIRARCQTPTLPVGSSLWVAARDVGLGLGLGLVGGTPPPLGDPVFDAAFHVFAADLDPRACLPAPAREALRALSRVRGNVAVRSGKALAGAAAQAAQPPIVELTWRGGDADPGVLDMALRALCSVARGRA